MDLNKVINGLHRLERAVLPVLSSCNDVKGIEHATGLKEVEIVRALQWLQNKELIILKEDLKEVINLRKSTDFEYIFTEQSAYKRDTYEVRIQ